MSDRRDEGGSAADGSGVETGAVAAGDDWQDDEQEIRSDERRRAEKVLLAVTGPQPEGLSERADRRRRLAERLLVELAYPPYGRSGLGNDFVAATAVPTTLEDAPAVRTALDEGAAVALTRPGDVRTETGSHGMWVRVHGPTTSVVFKFLPAGRSVFVCVDDLPSNCWQIDRDTEAADLLVHRLFDALVLGWKYDVAGPGSTAGAG